MYALWGKAVLDRSVAALLLVLGAPVLALLALAVLLALGRPILFHQRRAGRHGAAFTLIKFRSMDEGSAPDAARLGRFGRWLRASALDELPQLFNVLRGDMRLVGPRPLPRRDFENYYEEWHYGRHAGMPGLTCLWQVSGRKDVPWDDRMQLDLAYLGQASLGTDLSIIVRTVPAIVRGKGAY